MKTATTGTGYVGLVTCARLLEMGNQVFYLDLDSAKIKLLNDGGCPIHEPGWLEVLRRNVLKSKC
jgi:UDPglucose 6-dehydrogenase